MLAQKINFEISKENIRLVLSQKILLSVHNKIQ